MTLTEYCDICAASTEFEPHPRIPFALSCALCGHIRIDRHREPMDIVLRLHNSARRTP